MRIFYPIFFALLLSGCELFGVGESGSVHARTDQEKYITGEPVTYSLINDSYKTASFANCNELVYQLERREGRSWVIASASVCLLVVSPPLEILPQHTYEGKVTISTPGTYRLGFIRYIDKDDEEVYTNSFSVIAAE